MIITSVPGHPGAEKSLRDADMQICARPREGIMKWIVQMQLHYFKPYIIRVTRLGQSLALGKVFTCVRFYGKFLK
jgi:hypothetical protein